MNTSENIVSPMSAGFREIGYDSVSEVQIICIGNNDQDRMKHGDDGSSWSSISSNASFRLK